MERLVCRIVPPWLCARGATMSQTACICLPLRQQMDPGAVPMFGDHKPFTYLAANSNIEERVKLSPDGAFVAYSSTESKSSEIQVETFPEHSGKWQVSSEGGDWPVWSRDGHELYFLSTDNKMMAVAVKTRGRDFEAGVPRALFPVPGQQQFNIGRDGRFLDQVPQTTTQNFSINIVVNWQSALKK